MIPGVTLTSCNMHLLLGLYNPHTFDHWGIGPVIDLLVESKSHHVANIDSIEFPYSIAKLPHIIKAISQPSLFG